MEKNQIWPGWEIVRTIGKGSFGMVYEIRKVDNSNTGEYRSALKAISIPSSEDEYAAYKDDGYDDASITTIFKSQMDDIVKEFALMSQFKGTANIVSYEDHMIVPHDNGCGWDILIRMELLTSLPAYYEKMGMSEMAIIKLGTDMCRALELCAQKKVIHRDIKPQNIFVNEFGDFKLGDFGIAKTMEHTTKATKVGTYSYMAPEVYTNRPYNESVDIYSLGLVLYWLLNDRRLPFLPLPPAVPTVSQNEGAQRKRMVGEEIPAPKNGSPALKAVVLKACAYDPSHRYHSATEMKAALKSLSTLDEEDIIEPAEGKRETVRNEYTQHSEVENVNEDVDGAGNIGNNEAQKVPNGVYHYVFKKKEQRKGCKEPDIEQRKDFNESEYDKTKSIWDDVPQSTPDSSYHYVYKKGERRDNVKDARKAKSTFDDNAKDIPNSSYHYVYKKGERREDFKDTRKANTACGDDVIGTKKKASTESTSRTKNSSIGGICPWCGGSGQAMLVTPKKENKYIARKDSCRVCDGTGKISAESVPTITKNIVDITFTQQYRTADKSCKCCGGKGFVHFCGSKLLQPCPMCISTGNKVKILPSGKMKKGRSPFC